MISHLAVTLWQSCRAEALGLKMSPMLLHPVPALVKGMMEDCE